MDFENDDIRSSYRASSLGYGLLGLALLLIGINGAALLFGYVTLNQKLLLILWHPWRELVIQLPVNVALLLGSLFLLNRWSNREWRRVSGILAVLAGGALMLWIADNAFLLGLSETENPHSWVCERLDRIVKWLIYAHVTYLALLTIRHKSASHTQPMTFAESVFVEDWNANYQSRPLLNPDPSPGRLESRVWGWIGAGVVFWFLMVAYWTNWAGGWPLAPRPMRTLEALMMQIVALILWSGTSLQVARLCFTAFRRCMSELDALTRVERGDDLILLRSPSDRGFDDLR